jgi:hypothetical protein
MNIQLINSLHHLCKVKMLHRNLGDVRKSFGRCCLSWLTGPQCSHFKSSAARLQSQQLPNLDFHQTTLKFGYVHRIIAFRFLKSPNCPALAIFLLRFTNTLTGGCSDYFLCGIIEDVLRIYGLQFRILFGTCWTCLEKPVSTCAA